MPPWCFPTGPDLLQPSDSCILPSRRGYPASSSPNTSAKELHTRDGGYGSSEGSGVAEAAASKLAENTRTQCRRYEERLLQGRRDRRYLQRHRIGAKVLFVGLGVPKQEYWLEDNLAKTGRQRHGHRRHDGRHIGKLTRAKNMAETLSRMAVPNHPGAVALAQDTQAARICLLCGADGSASRPVQSERFRRRVRDHLKRSLSQLMSDN